MAADTFSLLLVDDEERVARYLTKRLVRKVCHEDTFTDPKAALEALEQNPKRWNVAVVDYMMPRMKGTVLARQIKIARPHMGIVMVTGLVESDALQMKQEGVIDSILLKPVNFAELLGEIHRTVSGKEKDWGDRD